MSQPEGQKGALLFNIIFAAVAIFPFPFFSSSSLQRCHPHFVDPQQWADMEHCQVSTRVNQYFLVRLERQGKEKKVSSSLGQPLLKSSQQQQDTQELGENLSRLQVRVNKL